MKCDVKQLNNQWKVNKETFDNKDFTLTVELKVMDNKTAIIYEVSAEVDSINLNKKRKRTNTGVVYAGNSSVVKERISIENMLGYKRYNFFITFNTSTMEIIDVYFTKI